MSYGIAICTYNRAQYLNKCLASVLLARGTRKVPVIVVDNGSDDETPYILSRYADQIIVVNEATVGLSNARNRAVKEIAASYVVYLDDDAMVESSWFEGIEEAIAGSADVFGGPIKPIYESKKPEWFSDAWETFHVDYNAGAQPRGAWFAGANIGFRKSMILELGGFHPALGMSGKRVVMGEDTAIQDAIWRTFVSPVFFCSLRMSVVHHVPNEKLTLRYRFRRGFGAGRVMQLLDPNSYFARAPMICLLRETRLGLNLLFRLIFRDRVSYPLYKQYAAVQLNKLGVIVGVIYSRLGFT